MAAPPPSTLATLLLLLTAACLPAPSLQLSNCGLCVCDRPSITCDFDKSQARVKESSIDLADFVPSSATLRSQGLEPLGYRDLYINCKNSPVLRAQRLTRQLVGDFVNLTRLAVVKCDLVAIEADALAGLSRLRELDVSDNQLERLPAGLLRSKTMSALTLSENPSLQLEAHLFRGVTLQRLVLSNSQLTEFPLDSLQAVSGLQELTLSHNRIKFVPKAAAEFVSRLRVFYLDDNPLSCTCANRWLRERVRWETVSPPIIKVTSKQPKCGSPPALQDIEITRLSPSDLPCQAPEIRSVDVRLEADTAQLVCSAATDQPGPLLWTYRHAPIYPSRPHGYPSRTYQGSGPTFRQSVRRTPGYEQEKYILTASGEDGQTANFSLVIHWPEPAGQPGQEPKRTTQEASGASDQQQQAGGTAEPRQPAAGSDSSSSGSSSGGSYFSRKQFTLIEMIIAVIGTFMATSLVFLLSCQFTRWYNKRDKKRWAAGGYAPGGSGGSGGGGGGSGGGQSYAYNYTAHRSYNSHRPPSHEYDVPRIDQSCLSKPPLPQQQQPQQQQQLPPPVPLPMPTSMASTAGASTATGTQTLASQQQQQLLPKPPMQPPPPPPQTTTSSSDCDGVGLGELKFLDYGGHRFVLSN